MQININYTVHFFMNIVKYRLLLNPSANSAEGLLNWNPNFQFAKLTSGSGYLLQD